MGINRNVLFSILLLLITAYTINAPFVVVAIVLLAAYGMGWWDSEYDKHDKRNERNNSNNG